MVPDSYSGVAWDVPDSERSAQAGWHEWERSIQRIEQICKEHPRPFLALLRYVIVSHRTWRRDLWRRFGRDVLRPWRMCSERWPQTELDLVQMTWALRQCFVWHVALHNMMVAAIRAHELGEDPHATLTDLFGLLRELPPLLAGIDMTRGVVETQRTWAIGELGGWAASHLTLDVMPSGQRNERIIAALRADVGSDPAAMAAALLERLMTAVPLAWSERQPDEPVTRGRNSLRNRIARQVEQDRPSGEGDVESLPDARPRISPYGRMRVRS